ncbi:MAG: alpha/beta hydrolase [Bacteroidota bacterium]|nr:alpha/beta hydrolase [Bacteroidota bacterium]
MIKTTAFKNGTVSFSDQGKGRVVVLLHGYLGSKELWEKNIPELAKTFRVITIDLPGHGQTACFGYVHSMELMAKCVKKVMDSLRLKKYVIVGHSMGGYAALAFAELYPENLCGLCLCHSTALPDLEEKKKDRTRAIKLVKANKRVYTKDTIKNLFATKNLKYLKDEVSFATKIALSTSKQGAVAALEGMKDRPNRDIILGMVGYPAMMIIGEHDNILPFESLLAQSETIRDKHVLLLEHDGHMGFLESPLVVNKALKKFINACFW